MSRIARVRQLAAALVALAPLGTAAQPAASTPTSEPEPELVRLVQEAEYHAHHGQLEVALSRYEQALAMGAGSAEVLNRVAELYLLDRQPQKTVDLLHRSLRERPAQLPAYSGLNEAFLEMGKLDSAVYYVREARRLAPENSAVRSQLAFLYMQGGDLATARAQLDSAIALDDRNAHAHRLLALWYSRNDQPDSAIARYRIVLELRPEDVESHNNIAYLLASQKKYLEALAWYDKTKALTDDPNLLHAVNLNASAIRAIMDGKMRARFILVSSEAQARDIRQKAEAGADFSELAARFSKAPNARDGGDLGFFGPGDMLPAVEEGVLRLQVGEVSAPIHIEQGYMLLQRLN